MICELSDKRFKADSFERKVEYSQKKIDNDKAELLYTNMNFVNLSDFEFESKDVVKQNDRVANPFNEIVISLAEGETLPKEKFIEIANDYMTQMGYSNAYYAIVQHNDTDKSHVHILTTAIDLQGKWISDSKEKLRSQKISRALEKKYGLQETIYNAFNSQSLGEIKAREYYFHNALQKGLKDYKYTAKLGALLTSFDFKELNISRSNSDYIKLFGNDLYDRVGSVLEKGKFFNTLYKDEILEKLDNAFIRATSMTEFRNLLKQDNIYMRMTTNKGKTHYQYGLDKQSIYFKDSSFPQKYRYTYLEQAFLKIGKERIIEEENDNTVQIVAEERTQEKGVVMSDTEKKKQPDKQETIDTIQQADYRKGEEEKKEEEEKQEEREYYGQSLAEDLQKHLLYNSLILCLRNSLSYDEFVANIGKSNIALEQHSNSGGVYGLSFSLKEIDNPKTFKASEISRTLSFNNIMKFYQGGTNPLDRLVYDKDIVQEMQQKEVDNTILYSYSPTQPRFQEEEELNLSGKRRRRRNIKRGK